MFAFVEDAPIEFTTRGDLLMFRRGGGGGGILVVGFVDDSVSFWFGASSAAKDVSATSPYSLPYQ